MKLRCPNRAAPALDIIGVGMETLTCSYTVETITPIYGGGVDAGSPDLDMPVRPSAIRGQLRFWWRLINRINFPESKALFEAERALFGGLGSERSATASRVHFSVSNLAKVAAEQCANYRQRDDGTWSATPSFPFGPGYAQFIGQGKANRNNGVTDEPNRILAPGLIFQLHLSIRGGTPAAVEIWEKQLLPALRWWASFGGLGARTRRGMGAIRIPDLVPVTESEWTRHGCFLASRPTRPQAQTAWTDAIDKLKDFRQRPDFGRNPSSPGSNSPGRSRWPEADSIREITGRCLDRRARPAQNGKLAQPAKNHAPTHPARQSFPRAAFGLPIIFHFKDVPGDNTPAQTRLAFDPEDSVLYPLMNNQKMDRMASPLILKPMWNGGNYTPIALLLPHNHLTQMGVRLENSATGTRDFQPGQWWQTSASTSMTRSATANPLRGKTGDVLNDFLDFFRI